MCFLKVGPDVASEPEKQKLRFQVSVVTNNYGNIQVLWVLEAKTVTERDEWVKTFEQATTAAKRTLFNISKTDLLAKTYSDE